MPGTENKRKSRKDVSGTVWTGPSWVVVSGRLVPGPGRPKKVRPLFQCVADKLPFASLPLVRKQLNESLGMPARGVYLAHDEDGVALYGGRGDIFRRLSDHKNKYGDTLAFFSFYVISSRNHEREIETAILRAAGPQMALNVRKVRRTDAVGNMRDYEPGTAFFERQGKKGRKAAED